MKTIHALAAAVIALGGLALATPADAASDGKPAVAAWSGNVVLVGDRDWDNRRHWRRGGRDRGDGPLWRYGRRGDRDDDRHWRRDRDDRRGWRRDRDDRRGWRDDRRRDRDWDRDRGRHFGWDRDRWRYKDWWKKRKRWHPRHHPRHRHWIGRHLPRKRYIVIRDYDSYYLPPPRHGYFYARIDNDVFLVAEATKRIIDAFVLLDAVGR